MTTKAKSKFKLPDSDAEGCPFHTAASVKNAPSVSIINHEDVAAVLRDRNMAPLQFESGHNGQWFTQIVENSVIDLWGMAHFERRKRHAGVFNPGKLLEIETQAIRPGVIEPLIKLREEYRGSSEVPHADLVIMARRTAVRMAGLLLGIKGFESDEEVDEFDKVFRELERGGRSKYVDEPAPVVDAALKARERLMEQYVHPVWQDREPIARKILAGKADPSELPRDIISVMLLNPEHYDQHRGSRKGELAVLMIASIGSSVNGVCGVVFDLLNWLDKRAEDRRKISDPEFLIRAQQESYRLHQTGDLFRTATYDATLPSGLKVPKGTVVIIERTKANEALAAAGESEFAPDEFDPYRTLGHGFSQQGFAFGIGAHTCSGRPLMMGDLSKRDTVNRAGFSSSMISALFAAGVERLPGKPAEFYADMSRRETFKSFPVQFTALENFEDALD